MNSIKKLAHSIFFLYNREVTVMLCHKMGRQAETCSEMVSNEQVRGKKIANDVLHRRHKSSEVH
jgi:hypothetical protein